MTNQNIVSIYKATGEIVDNKAMKQELKNPFSVVYAAVKTRNKLTKKIEEIAGKEKELHNEYNELIVEATTDKERLLLNTKLLDDKDALFKEESEVDIHKINNAESEIIVKYLSGDATLAFMDFMVENS